MITADSVRHILDVALNGPARYTASHHFTENWAFVFVIAVFVAELVGVYVLAWLLVTFIENIPVLCRWSLRCLGVGHKTARQTFLELTIPADTTKSAYATKQLHILLSGIVRYFGFWDRLAARKKPYSLELVGTNDEGIRYVLMVPAREADVVQRNLRSYLPGVKVRQIDDYVASIDHAAVRVTELRLTSDFVLPLQEHTALSEHDPFAYIMGQMAKLAQDELVAMQIVTVPVYSSTHHRVCRRQRSIEGRIALGREVMSQLETQRTPVGYALWLLWYPPLWFLGSMGKVVAGGGQLIMTVFARDHPLPDFLRSERTKRRTDNPYDLELAETIKTKLDQHLYEVTIRLLVAASESATASRRLEALVASFEPFTTPYQSLGVRQTVPVLFPDRKQLSRFQARALSPHHLSQQTILAASELSDLYHFPDTSMVKAEGMVKSRSRELVVPLSLKRSDAKLDVVVGINTHGGDMVPVGMTLEQRQKHTYVIGKTGTGKTTMLTGMIYQDMMNGKGLAVLDPHGDMFQELLGIVPEHRRNDVVVFDPSDREYPVGLNILDPGIEFVSEDDRQERITSAVLSVFERLADEKQWGPRMEHILRNATLTALQLPNPTLYTIQRLLTEKSYQREAAGGLKDPVLKQFWAKEFKLMGTMQLSNAVSPLTHRLGHFITAKMSRHILLQEKSSLRIADIMDEGKILLVNLSKGDIGEDQSFFFGTLLTSLIWMAAYQRTKIPEKERRDFFLYVDEFQNFATKQFTDITSEGRKFHIPLIASHQNVAQIEDKSILKIVAGNAHAMVCLKASPDDEDFILPFMKPEVEKGDIINLAPHHFYMKTTGDESEDAFSGETVPFEAARGADIATEVVRSSREQYGTAKRTVEEYLDGLLEEPKKRTRTSADKAVRRSSAGRGHGVHGA
ncbi:MAG TPA: DUF87 domain-containing protein [Candidatus Saccharimonadales bacterium]|nr:DUF87 domain-containing protein [Candidatus Saccharimonadales bacterium]